MTNAIDRARYLMKCRNFSDAISVLNSKRENYEESFDFYYTLGLAFLYAGDTGSASVNFNKAREIRITDPNLMLAQAAIFLRRGETDRAVQYYLDILDMEPQNKEAKRALDFVREHGDYEEICRWVDDGRIELYYPSLGMNPRHIRNLFLCLFCGLLFGFLTVHFWPRDYFAASGRADLSKLMLNVNDKANLDKDIETSYNKASHLFQDGRDNAAQKELNKILCSNASHALKQKCRLMMGYFTEPTFDSLKDKYSYRQVAAETELYLDCYVDWTGRVSNAVEGANSYSCDLLVGYEDNKTVEGIVRVDFDFLPVPQVDGALPVRILGKIVRSDAGKLILEGKSIYQSVKNVYGE